MAQTGDFIFNNGKGSESIYGKTFKDENFEAKHIGRGILSMANNGKDTNGSQFFITFKDCPHLDNKHVVFGKLIKGFNALEDLENIASKDGIPLQEAVIIDCGVLNN
ncbi:peptidyl-prolyl cis-trans isomerase, putative [Ichthyophthirius multifiliis]|uniref:Peptidyl-prolyl cis-trans isomerase n=1 Tax=Ichthyophthirius multifiliis TaxID=5932 RepID=G0R127_ICHMU|nr:peptidyl-prolyl cis-trans isomerase, putative [Ichthyophthirius multifiliis]EGR28794.1 peptidyl-prolyl cis-trans isomerase, putative [Ichthyophthirius multifiliis]|eukprot:XP_004030030.1 peptidyl-prolyl cis-trans isomerase, putative [Ichthyophthirius multifiliis]